MDEYDGELLMLDDSFAEAIAGVEYNEEGEPLIKYHGPMLVELHMAFGFGEQEAYEEIDSWRGSEIGVIWPVNVVVRPDRPKLQLVKNKKDLH